jgi:trehalose 6-phosphate phosphatase
MTHALSTAGLARIREFASGPALLAFDIDGTLAPIVSLPRDARIPDRSQRLLAELAQHNTVAVITGRGVGDAQRMVKFKPRYLVGSHGAEGVPGFEAAGQSYARTCALWTQALHAEDEAWRTIPGVTLEEKTYSLAFHYRHAEDHDAAKRILESRILHLSPWPRMIAGKCVLNFVPRDAPHKGDALRALLAHSGCLRAVYVGDDITDEDVFKLKLPEVLSVRVDPASTSAADLFLDNQREVEMLLDALTLLLADRVPSSMRMGE